MQNIRLVGIDFLRAFAVVMIFLFHSKLNLDLIFGFFQKTISNGAACMEVFFLVSGLVVYYQYHTDIVLNYKNTIKFYKKSFPQSIPRTCL